MQALAASTTSEATATERAAVAVDCEQTRLAMAANHKLLVDLHLKLLTRLDAKSALSKLPILPTLTGKSD